MKQVLNPNKSNGDSEQAPNAPPAPPAKIDVEMFDKIVAESAENLKKFFESKEKWATEYVSTLENRVRRRELVFSPLYIHTCCN